MQVPKITVNKHQVKIRQNVIYQGYRMKKIRSPKIDHFWLIMLFYLEMPVFVGQELWRSTSQLALKLLSILLCDDRKPPQIDTFLFR